MLPVSFDFDAFDDWFKEEIGLRLSHLITSLTGVINRTDTELENINKLDLGESVSERMTRDIKALAYDELVVRIGELF